jgi:hypothetical protein
MGEKMNRKLLGLFIMVMVLTVMGCSNPATSSPDLITSTIVFADGSAVSKIIGSGAYTNAVSGVGSGAVTYRSGTPTTATVDVSTGAVTPVAAGTTVITASKAATSTHTAATNTYTLTVLGIGSAYQGGILAYILQSADPGYVAGVPHGIIAATADQSTGVIWAVDAYQGGPAVPGGATGTAIGTGLANTNAIVAQNGTATTYAAGLCDAYTNADTATGVYSDWYLPSQDELNKLYLSKAAIGGFVANNYWSSSEYAAYDVWYQEFDLGFQDRDYKCANDRVRAVRAF